MRTIGLILVLVLGVVATAGAARRFTRCCVDLGIPQVPGPVCAQVRGARHVGPRLVCRLLGGKPMGRGDCSPAVCMPPPGAIERSS